MTDRTPTLGAAPFDVCGPLPAGTTVLEASAGTGKTFTIAALAARYVAEGHAELGELMLVTFGRAATRELRERVRDRFVHAQRGLADPPAARRSPDELLAHLATGDPDEVAGRRARLTRALAHFDAATIATTHQFCQQMLTGLGVAGDTDPDAAFAETLDDLIDEVVDDLYLRKYATAQAAEPAFDRALAGRIARLAVADPQARLEPAGAAADSPAGVRRAFAAAVRAEVARRKRARKLVGYDDLLVRLRDALDDPQRGELARARVRARYRVALVDEFQDTDPVQWQILRLAFDGHATLVLIGDPKQAIYAFRGADVASYLAAADAAGTQLSLTTNWRSDAALLSALETVFGGAALGDPRIVTRPVDSAHPHRRLSGAPAAAPLRLRVLARDGLAQSYSRVTAPAARERIAADVADDVVALLTAEPGFDGRAVGPGDIAVLVRTHTQADTVRTALRAAGVPAVLPGAASVFATPLARQWLTLLEALEQPQRATRVRAAALTRFLGWSVTGLDARGEDAVEQLGLTLRRWTRVLSERGVAALVEAITAETELDERLLATTDGERELTDLRHIGQALHAAAVDARLGLTALAAWLRHRIAESGQDTTAERSRRLESDADAVQVVTVHASKGLQFPVVYVPFGWDRWLDDKNELLLLHDDQGERVRDVGGSDGPGHTERRARHRAEELGEDLRLLYVALTRAQAQVVTWWAPATTAKHAPLHRLLFGRPASGQEPPQGVPVPGDDETAWRELTRLAGPDLAVEAVGSVAGTVWSPPRQPPRALRAARFDRGLDLGWRRTSYSALVAPAATQHGVGSEPEETERDDEPAPAVPAGGAAGPELARVASPMAGLATGTGFGTLVHGVLETADPTAGDLTGALATAARDQLARRPANVDPDELAAALAPPLRTPLGPVAGGRRLCDIAAGDRLTELDFELPLAGGDRPRAQVTLAQLGPALRAHLEPDDPLAGYPDLLDRLPGQALRGYLTGSIDAVLRLREADGPRFVVVDYKTNWLGEIGPAGPEPLTAADYSPTALTQAMLGAHYPLQALLYSVALHRYLRWRQQSYDPQRHLGGVLYLFLRGMCGPDTPTVGGRPCGVFGWQPPAALVEQLSRLLDTGAA